MIPPAKNKKEAVSTSETIEDYTFRRQNGFYTYLQIRRCYNTPKRKGLSRNSIINNLFVKQQHKKLILLIYGGADQMFEITPFRMFFRYVNP
jgi:hypothetical protein